MKRLLNLKVITLENQIIAVLRSLLIRAIELISPEVREHEIDLDDDEVDNVQPIELKQI